MPSSLPTWFMGKKKVLYVLSGIEKSLAFEWIINGLRDDYIFYFLVLGNKKKTPLTDYLDKVDVPYRAFQVRSKVDLLRAFIFNIRLVLSFRPAIIHAHLFEGYLVGIVSGWLCRVPKRIYSRHHSTIHHIYYPKGVKYDMLVNKMATHIVAPSKNVQEVLIKWEKVPQNKIHLIHHGFDLNSFQDIDQERIEAIKNKYKIYDGKPVIGVIARYIHCKGYQYIIPAFRSILNDYPQALLVVANATGDYSSEIEELLSELPESNYREILFENDIAALYQVFDFFLHTPINEHIEAFGQTYVEALAAGIPSVFTISGIAHEFIKDGKNALTVAYESSEQIHSGLIKLIREKELSESIVKYGRSSIDRFELSHMVKSLSGLYDQ